MCGAYVQYVAYDPSSPRSVSLVYEAPVASSAEIEPGGAMTLW